MTMALDIAEIIRNFFEHVMPLALEETKILRIDPQSGGGTEEGGFDITILYSTGISATYRIEVTEYE